MLQNVNPTFSWLLVVGLFCREMAIDTSLLNGKLPFWELGYVETCESLVMNYMKDWLSDNVSKIKKNK